MSEHTYLGAKDFAIFRAECQRWITRLGLSDWKIYYRFEEIEDGLAGCRRSFEGRCATIVLNPCQENCKREHVDVKRNAKHEVLHLLLAELDWLNRNRCVTDSAWMAAEHAVIRRLEGAL
jgi:hypothetical protein